MHKHFAESKIQVINSEGKTGSRHAAITAISAFALS
jgi:hypothetical protein